MDDSVIWTFYGSLLSVPYSALPLVHLTLTRACHTQLLHLWSLYQVILLKVVYFLFVLKHGKQQQSLAHSPKTRTTGFSVNTSPGCPPDSAVSNKWFKPEVDLPSSIRSIQIEEKAMKDLRRFYTNVKLVKNQSWHCSNLKIAGRYTFSGIHSLS